MSLGESKNVQNNVVRLKELKKNQNKIILRGENVKPWKNVFFSGKWQNGNL